MNPMGKSGEKGGKATPKNNQEFIDYRFGELHDKVDAIKTELKDDIKTVRDEVHSSFQTVDQKLDKAFATKDYVDNRFANNDKTIALLTADVKLLKKIVFGAVGLILTAFLVALVGLVIVNKQG